MASPSRIESKLSRELGRDILAALDDARTEDVVLNPDGIVWLKQCARPFVKLCRMDPDKATGAICTLAAMAKTVINDEQPILETELPGGYRFEALVKPVTTGPVFAIRKRPTQKFTLEDYRRDGILGKRSAAGEQREPWCPPAGADHADILQAAIADSLNILFVGPPGGGKTELLKTALDAVDPGDRLVLIEDVAELQSNLPNVVYLRAVESADHPITMLRLVKASLRLRPTRIIVGEVRGGEAHALLKAWNTGHPGGMASVHSNDARSGLARLESLVGEAPEARGVPQQALIAEAVQLVVFIDHSDEISAGRVVREVCLVRGWKEGKYEVEYV